MISGDIVNVAVGGTGVSVDVGFDVDVIVEVEVKVAVGNSVKVAVDDGSGVELEVAVDTGGWPAQADKTNTMITLLSNFPMPFMVVAPPSTSRRPPVSLSPKTAAAPL